MVSCTILEASKKRHRVILTVGPDRMIVEMTTNMAGNRYVDRSWLSLDRFQEGFVNSGWAWIALNSSSVLFNSIFRTRLLIWKKGNPIQKVGTKANSTCQSLALFVGLLSSGSPPRLVPGRLLGRKSLSSWLTRRAGYCVDKPSKQFALGLSPFPKK